MKEPELRKDPVTDRWVIISSVRAGRPYGYSHGEMKNEENIAVKCPFCEGNEKMTPPEISAIRKNSDPDQPGWDIRIVPNKYPALVESKQTEESDNGLYRSIKGAGLHEVLIETTEHNRPMSQMSKEKIIAIFSMVRERFLVHSANDRIVYSQFFRNSGQVAGASLPHPHSQIIGLPVVSKHVAEELDGSSNWYKKNRTCLFCHMIKKEIDDGRRVIADNKNYLVFAPYAPRFSYECWIVPKKHNARFENIDMQEIENMASALLDILGRLDKTLKFPAFNILLHTAPFTDIHNKNYHWHIEITPILSRVAGFEWSSGFNINPLSPEESAKQLRNF